jgi:hypothetical protein
VQPDQYGGRADGAVDGRAGVGGIDDDLLADAPVAIPPGMGIASEGEDGGRKILLG